MKQWAQSGAIFMRNKDGKPVAELSILAVEKNLAFQAEDVVQSECIKLFVDEESIAAQIQFLQEVAEEMAAMSVKGQPEGGAR